MKAEIGASSSIHHMVGACMSLGVSITTRIKQRFGFDGQVYAVDDGIVLRLPDGYGDLPTRELLLFDVDELQRTVETQVGESVLYMARFRELCGQITVSAAHTSR